MMLYSNDQASGKTRAIYRKADSETSLAEKGRDGEDLGGAMEICWKDRASK